MDNRTTHWKAILTDKTPHFKWGKKIPVDPNLSSGQEKFYWKSGLLFDTKHKLWIAHNHHSVETSILCNRSRLHGFLLKNQTISTYYGPLKAISFFPLADKGNIFSLNNTFLTVKGHHRKAWPGTQVGRQDVSPERKPSLKKSSSSNPSVGSCLDSHFGQALASC